MAKTVGVMVAPARAMAWARRQRHAAHLERRASNGRGIERRDDARRQVTLAAWHLLAAAAPCARAVAHPCCGMAAARLAVGIILLTLVMAADAGICYVAATCQQQLGSARNINISMAGRQIKGAIYGSFL